MGSDEFTAKLISSSKKFTFDIALVPNKVSLSDDKSELTIIGTRTEINSLLPTIKFKATTNGINAAIALESQEKIDILDEIDIIITAVRNNKKYTKSGKLTLILDSYKHSYFDINSTTKVFLQHANGVTWSDFYLSGKNYIYAHDDIVDAEKTFPIGDSKNNPYYDDLSDWRTMDDNLCWAASLSNMLEFTGWGRSELGLAVNEKNREDKFFRYFINSTQVDKGYNQWLGMIWFSRGEYTDIGGWKKKPSAKGNVLNGFKIDEDPTRKLYFYSTSENQNNVLLLFQLMDIFLKNGCGVGLGVSDTSGYLGHAITLVGIAYNTTYDISNPNHYTGVFVTDSDNQHGDPPSQHKDIVTYAPITYNASLKNYVLDLYSGYGYGKVYITFFCVLGRNNNDYTWFWDNGMLTDSSGDELRSITENTSFTSIQSSKFCSTDHIYN